MIPVRVPAGGCQGVGGKKPLQGKSGNKTTLILSEEQEQELVANVLDLFNVCFTAVPNGGKRFRKTAARLKATGTKKGVQDILIFDSPPNSPELKGAALEMKRRVGGRESDDQKAWRMKLFNRNWAVAVCAGFDEAIKQLKDWGYIPKTFKGGA